VGDGIMPGSGCNSLAKNHKILIQIDIDALARVRPDVDPLQNATEEWAHDLTLRRDAFPVALFCSMLRFASDVAFHLRSIR